MKGKEIRTRFLDFFARLGHRQVPSAPLVPLDDPSVLLTTAGMQPFKAYFVGSQDPLTDPHPSLGGPLGVKRVVSVQKCLRTSDIDEVGDNSHLTFFEMLGNFSFGDYWKPEAIHWACEFLVQELGVTRADLVATYFGGGDRLPADLESKEILEGLGFRPVAGSRADNFWGPTGEEGPCGPTVEFLAGGVELWNLVFNEYYCQKDGSLKPLTIQGVDTGAGLERVAAFLQTKESVYETDLLKPLTDSIQRNAPMAKSAADWRIAVDHLRAVVFLLADHVRPSNKEQGYILRRLLRRLMIKLDALALSAELLNLMRRVIELYGDFYPELKREEQIILTLAAEEEMKFDRTLEAGNRKVEELIQQTPPGQPVSGSQAFAIFASFGTPVDHIRERAKAAGLKFGEVEFEKAFNEHQAVSRAGREKKFGGHGLAAGIKLSTEEKQKITRLHTATHLLHAALRKFLGETIHQAGSDINPERTRFDFTFPRRLTEEEKKTIESWVNEQIQRNLVVESRRMPYEEALKAGALAFFKEKYGPEVMVYTIKDEKTGEIISRELCGGPHVGRTSQIGRFRLLKEESSSAGVRRIRATVE